MDEFNYNRDYNTMEYGQSRAVAENSLIKNVYLWMTGALVITALVAYYVACNPGLVQAIFTNKILGWGLFIAEFGIVAVISGAIKKINALTATLLFLLYSVINGVFLSSIFMLFQISSICSTFMISASTFGVMAVYGTITKTNLTKIGNICFMGLIGIVIASIVNVFLGNGPLDIIISVLGVIIFVGLTAWDAQKIKNLANYDLDEGTAQKYAVLGALTLYLDFVNIFLFFLRIFGKRR